jgi:hypothetical protein
MRFLMTLYSSGSVVNSSGDFPIAGFSKAERVYGLANEATADRTRQPPVISSNIPSIRTLHISASGERRTPQQAVLPGANALARWA